MATVVFTYDHSRDPMNPDDLASRIASTLSLNVDPNVNINPTQIVVVHPNVTEANRVAIQGIIDAYVLDPDWSAGYVGALRAKAQQALAANATFLALATPNQAQTLAQVQRLTRECSGLIRAAYGLYDSSGGL